MSQESKAIARSAELMAGSARAMQGVAEHISRTLEAQNLLFEGLIETMQKQSSGGGSFGGSGLGALGGGVKKLAGGLGDLARVLPELVKGLTDFRRVSKGVDVFISFVTRMQESIGKSTTETFVPWSAFGTAVDSMSGGLAKLSLGLFAFGALTSEETNNRFIDFIGGLR